MKNGTQIDADVADFTDFYPCKSVLSVCIRVLFSGHSLEYPLHERHNFLCVICVHLRKSAFKNLLEITVPDRAVENRTYGFGLPNNPNWCRSSPSSSSIAAPPTGRDDGATGAAGRFSTRRL